MLTDLLFKGAFYIVNISEYNIYYPNGVLIISQQQPFITEINHTYQSLINNLIFHIFRFLKKLLLSFWCILFILISESKLLVFHLVIVSEVVLKHYSWNSISTLLSTYSCQLCHLCVLQILLNNIFYTNRKTTKIRARRLHFWVLNNINNILRSHIDIFYSMG